MKLLAPLLFSLLTIIQSCTDDSPAINLRTQILVDVIWFHSETIGTPPMGYAVHSGMLFNKDKTVMIGYNLAEWKFIDNGQSLRISFPQFGTTNRFEIVHLTKKEFRFKHYGPTGELLIEFIYVTK